MYTLYGTLRSRAFRVIWALEELGQPYDLVQAGPRSDEIRAVNKSGKIPALDVDGEILTDSTAIMSFLSDRHGGLTYPAGSLDRARLDAMLHRLNDEFDSILWMATKHSAILPEEMRAPAVVDTCKWEYGNSLARLGEDLTGDYLVGDSFTIADILAVHCFGWAHSIGFPGAPDNLRAYAKSMRARPGFAAAGRAG